MNPTQPSDTSTPHAMTDPLTAGELLGILAVLLARLGKDHPLTRRVQALHHAQPKGETE